MIAQKPAVEPVGASLIQVALPPAILSGRRWRVSTISPGLLRRMLPRAPGMDGLPHASSRPRATTHPHDAPRRLTDFEIEQALRRPNLVRPRPSYSRLRSLGLAPERAKIEMSYIGGLVRLGILP